MEDVVAEYPDEIAQYKKEHGSLPESVEYEPGFYLIWENRYFIHTRATLPLKDIGLGVGFGLWVELGKENFKRYLEANEDDEKYKSFKTEGVLANQWPGFENILGVQVVVRCIKQDEKVYITEVKIHKPRDVLFEVALRCRQDDLETKEQIKKLVMAYMEDIKGTIG